MYVCLCVYVCVYVYEEMCTYVVIGTCCVWLDTEVGMNNVAPRTERESKQENMQEDKQKTGNK